jgi:sodium/potassium-transporting ATPase subunit alpha
MVVTDCYAGGQEYNTDAAKTAHNGSGTSSDTAIKALRIAGALCNAADFDYSAPNLKQPVHAMRMHGDPTDQAILRFSQLLEAAQNLRREWRKEVEVAFTSRNEFKCEGRMVTPGQMRYIGCAEGPFARHIGRD